MTKEIYNEFYQKHGVGVHSDPYRFRETAKFCKGRILDIGCGTGDLADFYSGEYMGVDISDVAILLAEKTRRETARFYVGDLVEEHTLEEEKFDTFVIAEVLEHIEDDSVLLDNVKKMASDNARIIISVPNGNRVPDKNHLREFTVPELRAKFSPFGKVKFHNWVGFEHRILMTVEMGEENADDLTLSMMCWNEEKGLEKAILSAIEIVDKIVISIDNKSDDKTLAIALRYADVIKRHEWENDFAKVRNFTQEGITSKWILALDGHEFIEQSPFIETLLKEETDGLFVTVRMETGETFVTTRIYRNGLIWEHAIHNSLPVKTTTKYSAFIIVHDREGGQSEESTKKRLEQVRDTMGVELKKEIKNPKTRIRALFYLARYYRQFYQWKKALKYYKKYIRESKFVGEKWLCCYEAGVIANTLGKPLTALRLFEKANQTIPDRWEIYKQIGLVYMTFERHKKALVYLIRSLEPNKETHAFNPEKPDAGDTWDKIGFCFFHEHKYFEAKQSWERAVEIGTDKIQVKMNKARIEMLERQYGV